MKIQNLSIRWRNFSHSTFLLVASLRAVFVLRMKKSLLNESRWASLAIINLPFAFLRISRSFSRSSVVVFKRTPKAPVKSPEVMSSNFINRNFHLLLTKRFAIAIKRERFNEIEARNGRSNSYLYSFPVVVCKVARRWHIFCRESETL